MYLQKYLPKSMWILVCCTCYISSKRNTLLNWAHSVSVNKPSYKARILNFSSKASSNPDCLCWWPENCLVLKPSFLSGFDYR